MLIHCTGREGSKGPFQTQCRLSCFFESLETERDLRVIKIRSSNGCGLKENKHSIRRLRNKQSFKTINCLSKGTTGTSLTICATGRRTFLLTWNQKERCGGRCSLTWLQIIRNRFRECALPGRLRSQHAISKEIQGRIFRGKRSIRPYSSPNK